MEGFSYFFASGQYDTRSNSRINPPPVLSFIVTAFRLDWQELLTATEICSVASTENCTLREQCVRRSGIRFAGTIEAAGNRFALAAADFAERGRYELPGVVTDFTAPGDGGIHWYRTRYSLDRPSPCCAQERSCRRAGAIRAARSERTPADDATLAHNLNALMKKLVLGARNMMVPPSTRRAQELVPRTARTENRCDHGRTRPAAAPKSQPPKALSRRLKQQIA